MADILIKDFPMPLNGRWGTYSDHIVIHGDGSVTYTDGHYFGNAKAIEVVRCKDCEWATKSTELPGWYMCKCEEAFDYYAKPDDFCSHRKRREE